MIINHDLIDSIMIFVAVYCCSRCASFIWTEKYIFYGLDFNDVNYLPLPIRIMRKLPFNLSTECSLKLFM